MFESIALPGAADALTSSQPSAYVRAAIVIMLLSGVAGFLKRSSRGGIGKFHCPIARLWNRDDRPTFFVRDAFTIFTAEEIVIDRPHLRTCAVRRWLAPIQTAAMCSR